MQWDASANAGFTSAEKPWLAVNPNYETINAAAALADPDSIYHYTQRLLSLRKSALAFVYGDYEDLAPKHPSLFLFARTLGNDRYLIALNFSRETIAVPNIVAQGNLILSNGAGTSRELKGWEARIVLA